jgi:polysaccharide export outer membrane protein
MAVPGFGCASLGAGGPSGRAIVAAQGRPLSGAAINVVGLTDEVARQLVAADRAERFSDLFGETAAMGSLIGRGDVLEISMWEAPPAVLFGSALGMGTSALATSQSLSQPGQVVDENGLISVPFAGSIRAAGRTPAQIERDIVARLRGKANMPQAAVRLVRNQATNVTVVGDVPDSGRIPLTPKGERLLDVLASAGGARNDVSKTVVQLTRGDRVASMPLSAIIGDHRQNIVMRPDDIVSVSFKPYSFTAFGATGSNNELPFEATGISLAQALGRVGGLKDDRADIGGVFLFRLEQPALLGSHLPANARLTADGKLPVIYRLDLKSPASLFVAQSFPIRTGDVLYVSNAPMSDLQKFASMVSTIVFPAIGIRNAIAAQ